MSSRPRTLQSLTIFCGSSPGHDPAFTHAAASVGRALAREKVALCYGGGTTGLMGSLALACLENGGVVHGVIPTAFQPFPPSHPLSPSHIPSRHTETKVRSMHERKKIMSDQSEGFVGLPGGLGTLEECAEMATWGQLGVPVVLLNISSFFTPLRDFIQGSILYPCLPPSLLTPPTIHSAIKSGFIAPQHAHFLTFLDPLELKEGERGKEWDWGEEVVRAMRGWIEPREGEEGEEGEGRGWGRGLDLVWEKEEEGEAKEVGRGPEVEV